MGMNEPGWGSAPWTATPESSRLGGSPTADLEDSCVSSPAPKRRLDVRQATSVQTAGKRAAVRPRRRRRTLRPTPAMAGAFVLIVAGVGAGAVSSRTDRDALDASYQTISASYTGSAGESAASSDVDVSRDFDRDLLEKQTQAQADQLIKVQEETRGEVEAAAEELQANQWVLPVTGYRITARFGQSSSLWSNSHTGVDMAGPAGSTIVSVAAGTVKSAGYAGAFGNRTVVTLEDGTELWYAHQSRIVVKAGDKVSPGQTIGYTGSTGNVTGPHLHLEVRPGGGDPVDPIPALAEHNIDL